MADGAQLTCRLWWRKAVLTELVQVWYSTPDQIKNGSACHMTRSANHRRHWVVIRGLLGSYLLEKLNITDGSYIFLVVTVIDDLVDRVTNGGTSGYEINTIFIGQGVVVYPIADANLENNCQVHWKKNLQNKKNTCSYNSITRKNSARVNGNSQSLYWSSHPILSATH